MLNFSTDVIRPKERFDYWREVVSSRFVPMKPERLGELPFKASLNPTLLGDLPLTRIRVQGQRVVQSETTHPDEGFFCLILQLTGVMHYEQGCVRQSTQGTGFLIDSSYPFELNCPSDMTHLCLQMPKGVLAPRVSNIRRIAGRQLRPERPAALLCLDYLFRLGVILPTQDRALASLAVNQLLELLAYALNDAQGTAPPRDTIATAIYRRACLLIDRDCGHATLTPARVAEILRTPLRSLQKAFQSQSDTVSAYLARARLALAQTRLRDPRWGHCSVTQIALLSGFNDVSYFSRCFGRATGFSPGQWRAQYDQKAPSSVEGSRDMV